MLRTGKQSAGLSASRIAAVVGWFIMAASGVYVYVAHRLWLREHLEMAMNQPPAIAAAIVFVLGALRGFSLIPATVLVLAATPFLPPTPLFLVILMGIVVASSAIYVGAGALDLVEYAEQRDPRRVAILRTWLDRFQFPVILVWSFFPLAPTDLISALCGTLRVRFAVFIAAVTLGEGSICAIYIYGGDQLLRWLHLR